MNLNMLRAQLNISTTESSAESIYDTLDKVVKEAKNHVYPKVTAERGEEESQRERERERQRERGERGRGRESERTREREGREREGGKRGKQG